MTKKKIRESALISKWHIPFDRASTQCHIYWVISPWGGIKDLYIMDVMVEIDLLNRDKIKPIKMIKDSFDKAVDDLYRDWKKGKITRRVLEGFEHEERTLVPNPLTVFFTDIPEAYKDEISHYKE